MSYLLIKNPKAKSGYSQIDHVVLTPYGIFVIETKNYQGMIYGGKDRKIWSVNGKFKMMNPFVQNYGHIKALASLIDRKFKESFRRQWDGSTASDIYIFSLFARHENRPRVYLGVLLDLS
ncbi:nuclease-related domain-containing protein [Mesobacillus jeotgali]|uniref:nuclease-related domain-containing protein n=1 Tax=Mesobacillus jeotgali TaxID=129985 RepID=UPI0027D47518|nr:nuclease-related domain-containing protein [Mesobacillus jeotgali]